MTKQEEKFREALQRNKDEYEKCKEDPVYFYNTYVKPKDAPALTKEQYNRIVDDTYYIRLKIKPRRIGRQHLFGYYD